MDFAVDFAAAQNAISQALVETTRSASRASAHDTTFYRSLDPTVGPILDRQNSRILSLTQRLLLRCSPSVEHEPISLFDAESIDTSWRALIDIADDLLERTDSCLDEYNGLIKRVSPREREPPLQTAHRSKRRNNNVWSPNIAKPQLHFDVKPVNVEAGPFKPILTTKPHATVPFEQSQVTFWDEFGTLQYAHPYAKEIAAHDYPSFTYTEAEPQNPMPFESTTAVFVDSLEGVYTMLEELKQSTVIAVDLEHHDTHSYAGIVSLMQISTRSHDWIIDTLRPWRRKLEILNEVFADPRILKVLHGAQMDILWLQRDLGLYVVGLFDTHHASRVLKYHGGSLAFLLKKFVNFDAQKQYQTADWRMRPLPQEMFDYARSDTHFLLYIYDCMRNELLSGADLSRPEDNPMHDVLVRSKETALQRYEHFTYDETRGLGRGGWFGLLQRTPAMLSKEEFTVFRKIHQWRDYVARQEDESPIQIMPNHVLFSAARRHPRNLVELLSILHPISPAVRSRVSALLALIHEGINQAADEPDVNEALSRITNGTEIVQSPSHTRPKNPEEQPMERVGHHGDQESNGGSRASSSTFWGSALTDLCNVAREDDVLFEATPQVLAHGMDTSKYTTSETGGYRNGYVPRKVFEESETTAAKSALGKRRASETNQDNAAVNHDGGPLDQKTSPSTAKRGSMGILKNLSRRAAAKETHQAYISDDAEILKTRQSFDLGSVDSTNHFNYAAAESVLNANEQGMANNGSRR